MTQLRTWATLIGLGVIFGSAFLYVKVLGDEMDTLTMVGSRLVLGALIVLAVLAVRRKPLGWTPALAGKVALLAALGLIIPYGLIAWAETEIDSGIAAALISTMPLFTAVYASFLFTDERLTIGRIAGLLAGFAGVIALNGAEFDVRDSSVVGQLAVVAAAASYGLGAVYSRRLLHGKDAMSLAGLELTMGAVLAVPLALAFNGAPEFALSGGGWASLLALGIGSTGVAIVGYLWLVEQAGSVRASLVTYVVPVVGLFLGWAVLDESVGAGAVIGTTLIILGVGGAMLSKTEPAAEPAEVAEPVPCEPTTQAA